MYDSFLTRLCAALLAVPALLVAGAWVAVPGLDDRARRRFLLLALAALWVLLAALTARADSIQFPGGWAGSTGVYDGLAEYGEIPCHFENLTGSNFNFELCDSSGSPGSTMVLPPGDSGLVYIYFDGNTPGGQYYDQYGEPWLLDCTTSNLNTVVLQTYPGGIFMHVVYTPWLRPGGVQEQGFLWGWFLAGWGLAIGGIMSALVWRQVRNIGADAPTM
jgi:hypothetical protein